MENRTSLNWFLLIALALLVAAIMLELAIMLPDLVGDWNHCTENYGYNLYYRLHCMVTDGSFTGRYFVPEVTW